MAIVGPAGYSDEAIAELRWAVERAPNVPQLRHNLAVMLTRAGDVEAAAGEFGAALRLNPADTVAFYGFASNHPMRDEAGLAGEMERLFGDPTLSASDRLHLA